MKKSRDIFFVRMKRFYRITITIAVYAGIAYGFWYGYVQTKSQQKSSSLEQAEQESFRFHFQKRNPWKKASALLLTERQYLPETIKQIDRASRSVDVLMFVFNNKYKAEKSLLHALIRAKRRGRKVRVLVEFDSREDELNRRHEKLVQLLRSQGIHAWLDDPFRRLHAKLVSIDGGKVVITGSHNWTTPALTSLHEASLLIRNDTPPGELLDFIEDRFQSAQAIEKKLVEMRKEIEKIKEK